MTSLKGGNCESNEKFQKHDNTDWKLGVVVEKLK